MDWPKIPRMDNVMANDDLILDKFERVIGMFREVTVSPGLD
jgi:hypothetical protein